MAKFVKGQSGNPGGRPKAETTLRELARTHTETALKTLVQIMRNKRYSPQARAYAANSVLDRGYGKPAQSVDLTNSDGSLSQAWMAAMKSVDDVEESEEASVTH